ncbi:cation:proton antiporter [Sphingomonas rhizophila]|uniref:cation:proton antiporter domain-containing protein n=1 Tax=Sphingomonas rhizophila TaxID=2071607 RepID=UPI002484102F|nr:cation:proton antiporter [Sphingomonas rhizophila]
MDGAWFTALGRFRRHLPGILSLAVGTVVFTTLVVGVVTYWLVPSLPWAACFALGAIVSPRTRCRRARCSRVLNCRGG